MKQTNNMTLCALFIVLYIIASKLIIPVGIVPLTLQTLVVFLSGVLLKPKQILTSYGLFLFIGLVGLPVFANGGGLSYILQPTFGFLLAFPLAGCFISIIRHKFHLHKIIQIYPLCLIALCMIYAIGCGYMYGIFNFYMGVHKSVGTIIALGALPFLISDSVSALLGCVCALRLVQVPVIQRSVSYAE